MNRKQFARVFSRTFRVVLADDGVTGLERLREYEDQIGVVISDQRMPHESGADFLGKVALLKPSVTRIISTAYADIDAAISAINVAGVYRYVSKPWEIPELEEILKAAMDLYISRLEQDELLRQKSSSREEVVAFKPGSTSIGRFCGSYRAGMPAQWDLDGGGDPFDACEDHKRRDHAPVSGLGDEVEADRRCVS